MNCGGVRKRAPNLEFASSLSVSKERRSDLGANVIRTSFRMSFFQRIKVKFKASHPTAAPDIHSPCCISCWTPKNDHAPYHAPQPSHVPLQDTDAPTPECEAIDARYNFANAMLHLLDEGDIDVGNICFSDEVYFNLDGFVSKQNWYIWEPKTHMLLYHHPCPQK
ncbi:hypothetical protein AVEN_271682-1 [Araneus ventricosus]|uniref:Uncharacterized protein n=1 Tax=Araneus ventricosus TaxID=182803 RepID=A0A4Y2J8N0_ARAVE|nr:hypothetical protein AVEN_271682-1 [Araneus ventricosus]